MATNNILPTSSLSSSKLTNQCLESKSPYVRSHSRNPTAWQLWTPETLELSRTMNKLLFVSIGYSACHWCHVMADESFDNPQIASVLNDRFIPIKIDREERPDIDKVYMDFLQATTGGGGWPLNVFVTPDLQPIFGGTYWPGPGSERAKGNGGFAEVLDRVASAWEHQEAKCRENASQITAQLRQFAEEGLLGATSTKPDALEAQDLPEIELLEDAYEHYKMRFDSTFGGFGSAPKFPTPSNLAFLIRLGAWPATVKDVVGDAETQRARDMVVQTLRSMATGGIKDQVGHGFARYSVTRDWSLPHFEKMLYDNAQLLSVYLDGFLVEGDELLEETVHDIAIYLSTSPIKVQNGGLNASEDADSAISATDPQHSEGAFYVFTYEEFKKAVGDQQTTSILAEYYGVKPEGNVSPRHDVQGELTGKNTLKVSTTVEALAKQHNLDAKDVEAKISHGQTALRQFRETNRPRPGLDDKVVVSWNGLAIAALARTAAALAPSTSAALSDQYLTAASEAATFVKTNLYNPTDKTLKRVYREGPGTVPGFVDDYAFLISGLLELYTATFDESYLEWAYELQQTQLKLFYDFDGIGGFFSTAEDSPDVLIRSKDAMDNAEPSANGVSALNLFRLAALLSTSTATTSTSTATDAAQSALATSSSETSTAAEAAPVDAPSSLPDRTVAVGIPTAAGDQATPGKVSTPKPHQDLHTLAVRTLQAFDTELSQHPGLMTSLLSAVVHARLGTKTVLISGPSESASVQAALKTLRTGLFPAAVVLRVPPAGVGPWLAGMEPSLREVDGARELVQVCSGTECRVVGEGEGQDLASLLRA